jgi:hypothetical protein
VTGRHLLAAGLGAAATVWLSFSCVVEPEPFPQDERTTEVSFSRNPEGPVLCWVDEDGSIGCWPEELEQLDGFPSDSYQRVAVGDGHLCVLTDGGEVECWGWGDCAHGQCESPDGTFLQVRVGTTVNCAERDDHSVHCWGEDAAP